MLCYNPAMRYLLLLVLLVGCDLAPVATPTPVVIVVTATPAPTIAPARVEPTPAPTALPAIALVTFRGGNGPLNTDSFALAAGNYTARWAVTDPLGDCTLTVYLNSSTDTAYYHTTVFQAHPLSGQTASNNLYNIPAGQYYLEVHSSCSAWTITLTAQP